MLKSDIQNLINAMIEVRAYLSKDVLQTCDLVIEKTQNFHAGLIEGEKKINNLIEKYGVINEKS